MTEPLCTIEGIMAHMPAGDIDTDAIIPSEWLRTATADYGRGLFGRERYHADGSERPEFVLNRSPFRQARMLLAGENFGCGSSREAAVWALHEFGIRCVFAQSFANIFYENAVRNALLPGRIDPKTAAGLAGEIARTGQEPVFAVDLPTRSITAPSGSRYAFEVPAPLARMLIDGEDFIDAALQSRAEISAYHQAMSRKRPWLYGPLMKTAQSK